MVSLVFLWVFAAAEWHYKSHKSHEFDGTDGTHGTDGTYESRLPCNVKQPGEIHRAV